jgi:hypothetical protein
MSVRMVQLCSTSWIFVKFDVQVFFENLVEEIKVWIKSDKNIWVLYIKTRAFMIISHNIFLEIVAHKSCSEKENTQFMLSNLVSKNCAMYEVMW